MNKQTDSIPSVSEVEALLKLKKQLMRAVEWSNRIGGIERQRWKEFSTHCIVGSKPYPEVRFLARYKPEVTILDGDSATVSPEMFTFAMLLKGSRVFAIDKEKKHRNNRKKQTGRPYDCQVIDTPVHIHYWTEKGDYYAEPFLSDDDSFESVFEIFSAKAVLLLKGKLIHPMQSQQYCLFQ